MSFAFEPDDTTEQRISKLYLGIISVGEQLYTYNAAIAELRKGPDKGNAVLALLTKDLAERDKDLERMRQQFDQIKAELRERAGQLPDERFIVKPEAEWNV